MKRRFLSIVIAVFGGLALLGITVPANAAGCNGFGYSNLNYSAPLVGRARVDKNFYPVVENISSSTKSYAVQTECHSHGTIVKIAPGKTHQFKAYVGSGNPRVRVWLVSSPSWIPVGTYPSRKGAITLSTDSHPNLGLSLKNPFGSSANLFLYKAKHGDPFYNPADISASVGSGHIASVSTSLPYEVRHIRATWKSPRHANRVALDGVLLRLKN